MSNWADRFTEWTKHNPTLVVFFFTAVAISSLLTITGAFGQAYRWYYERFNWRDREYAKLVDLKAGYSLEKFKEQLGSPVFVRTLKKSKLTENSFRGRDYWVQAVNDSEGSVVQYAVTSCERSFRPTFSFGKGGSLEGRLTLNASTLASMDFLEVLHARYYISGATANSYLFESVSGGNPTQYKMYAWGVNFSCPSFSTNSNEESNVSAELVGKGYEGPTSEASPAIQEFRKATIINTYVETAPFADLVYGDQGDLGVDRLLIRTTT